MQSFVKRPVTDSDDDFALRQLLISCCMIRTASCLIPSGVFIFLLLLLLKLCALYHLPSDYPLTSVAAGLLHASSIAIFSPLLRSFAILEILILYVYVPFKFGRG